MTDEEIRAYVTESRARQGLPPKVTDPLTIQRIVDLILGSQCVEDVR